jgi:TonB family protein
MPVYPAEAKAAHISGTVVLHAIVAKDGAIRSLEVISGPLELTKSATDAVQQWRYKPTLLNHEPVEVDTTISVVFTLGGETPPAAEQESIPQIPGGNIPPSDLDSLKSQAEKPIDPQLKADILHLLDVAHSKDKEVAAGRELFQSLRPMIMSTLPPTPSRGKILDSYMEKILALFGTDECTDRKVLAYAKHLSDEDIKGLTQFYETPAGQHYIEVVPQLFGDLNRIGQQMVMENLTKIFKELCKEYPELQGAAQFCPKENNGDKSLLIGPNAAPTRSLAEVLGGK